MLNINSRTVWLVAAALALSACEENTDAPPLFNAIDPSLQCPAGQVGWDFTTGGGQDQDVLPAPVGNEIKIQEVTYSCGVGISPTSGPSSVDLTAEFRAECDNAVKCERPVLRPSEVSRAPACTNRTLVAKYKCGNEPTVYDISRVFWGNHRPSYGVVREPTNEPDRTVTFACGELINVKGYAWRLGGAATGAFSTVKNDLNSCTGKRRCYSNQFHDYRGSSNAIQNHLRYYYTCGQDPAVREAVIDNPGAPSNTSEFKNYVDFHCADGVAARGFERAAPIFVKDVTYVGVSGGYPDVGADTVQRIGSQVKTTCEGRRSCAVPIAPAELPNTQGAFKVEYWCGGARGVAETKYVYIEDIRGGSGGISLQCGGRLRIVSADNSWVASACSEGARVCSIKPSEATTRVNFFCENGADNASNSSALSSSDSRLDRAIECPLEAEGTGGISVVGLAWDGNPIPDRPPVSVFSACNGKQSCLVPHAFDSTRYQYRFKCPNASPVNSVKTTVNGSAREYLDCKPNVSVLAVRLTCAPNRNPWYSRTNAPICSGTSPSCTVVYPGNISNVEYLRDECNEGISVAYRCGEAAVQHATFITKGRRTADGGHLMEDGGTVMSDVVTCPYDPTPRASPVTKRCIPATCANNQKRDELMDCVNDAQIKVYPSFVSLPLWRTPQGALTNTVKEGFPYLTYLRVQHQAPAMSSTNAGTMWAYDVFTRKNNTGAEVRAFRCIVGSMGYTSVSGSFSYFGGGTLGDVAVLPDVCFKEAPYGDITSSWYHGSRRAGVMNEQVFRNEYNLVRTVLVAAFDSKGRAALTNQNAPNPVGFFFNPATAYIDQYEFLAQTTDFARGIAVNFVPSRQIELQATGGRLGQSLLLFDKETFKKPPTLDLDFAWNQLGDSPFHPFSDKRLVRPTNLAALGGRNPRVTVEIAKQDSALANIWVESNAAVVGSFSIKDGNAQEKKERYALQLPPDVVKRVMSVKGGTNPRRPDGWMQNNIEVNSVFKLRLCIDFDGISRNFGSTAINNQFTSANVGGNEYRLGVTKRCSDEYPFTVVRDLFPKPVLPINAAENPVENGNTTAQGGDRVSSNNDLANQQACRRQCTANSDCGGGGTCDRPPGAIGVCREQTENVQCRSTFRKGMTTGGKSFGRSIVSVTSTSDTDAAGAAPGGQLTSSSTDVALMGFNILDSEEKKEGSLVVGGTRRETKMSLGRIWASVAQIAKLVAEARKTNPSPAKPWYKPSFSHPFGGADSVPGIAFGIGADGYVYAGPVVLFLEISFGAQLGFDIVINFATDRQTIATMTPQAAYGCLGTAECLQASTTAKTFVEANQDCNLKGGRLAEARTSAKLTAIKSAAGSADVWIGAQASHIFDDPSCVDLSTVTAATRVARLAECKTLSVTRYHWINGNVAFSDNEVSGTGYNQPLYAAPGVQGFGTIASIANTGSPLRSAVLLKANGALENHPISDRLSATSPVTTGVPVRTARYVCEFDGAGAYKATEVTITPGLEVSVGVGASACWPSGIIGACLSAEFKFITVGVGLEFGSKSMKIYDTANTTTAQPRATIGGKGATAKWEWAALTGRLYAEIRYFIGSAEFNIVSYSGVAAGGGELWDNVERFRRDRP